MREFKISPKQIETEKRKRLIHTIPLVLIGLIAVFFIGLNRSDYKDMYVMLPLIVLLIVAAVVLGFRRSSKFISDSLSSYKIELQDNSIKQYQKNISAIEIQKAEVVLVTEVANKGITIKTNNSTKYIYIPVIVEGYSELKESLSEWMNITSNERNIEQFWIVISAVGAVLGLAVVMLCEYSYIVIPVGIVMIIVLLWCLVYFQKNPHLETRIKRTSLVCILPIGAILLRILSIILGWH